SLFSPHPAPPYPPPLSLHDALPISLASRLRPLPRIVHGGHGRRPRLLVSRPARRAGPPRCHRDRRLAGWVDRGRDGGAEHRADRDRKSTRLNSSHVSISYAVFCLKK